MVSSDTALNIKAKYKSYDTTTVFNSYLSDNFNSLKSAIQLNRFAILEKTKDLSNQLNTINTYLDLSFVTDLSFQEFKEQLNALTDLSFVTDLSFQELQTRVDTLIESSNNATNIGAEYVNNINQTFYEIITQQPHQFDSSGIPSDIKSSAITLSWNYDNIIAKHDGISTFAKLSFFNNNTQLLPYINYIAVDISGIVDTGGGVFVSTGWINHQNISISTNDNYNTANYKNIDIDKHTTAVSTELEKILSSNNLFDVRIYGVNYSENFPPIDVRAMMFSSIGFLLALPPSSPNLINETINSNSQITITYDVSNTELNNATSDAVLNKYIIDFSENDTTCSVIYPLNAVILSDNDVLSNIINLQDFNVVLSNLRSGTKYNYLTRVQNSLNDNSYSLDSETQISDFTFLPSSNGIGTTVNLSVDKTLYVSSPAAQGLNNTNITYINLSDNQNVNPDNTSNQSVEISKPYFSGQQNTDVGYGSFIENSAELVKLTVSLNGSERQRISFDGSFNSLVGNEEKLNSNVGINFDYISLVSGTSLVDIWNGNVNNRGFRLKGLMKLKQIPNANIQTVIGDPSTNPYILNYNYDRNVDLGGSNQNVSHNIYVDDLSQNPAIFGENTSNIVNVVYNFGIPSVKQFDLSFTRTYSNINSQFMYIPGNKIIADIKSISNTSASSTKNITLLNSEIVPSGIYDFIDDEFDSKTSNYYNSLHYTSSRLNAGNTNKLSWNEETYNLLKRYSSGITISQEHITNHYVDYNSFSKSGSKINNPNINLANIHIYEISNISLVGSNLGGLELEHYDDHVVQIREYTILNIDNKFQANSVQAYPNINDFLYRDGGGEVVVANDFSAGTISYDLNGVILVSSNGNLSSDGYKWIVFKLYKSGNNAYTFNETTHALETNLDNVSYLNMKTILTQNGMFTSVDVANIFDDSSDSAIGFARATRSDSVILVGNLKQSFNPTGGNWMINGSPANISYNNSLQLKYGAKVENGAEFGVYLSPTAINDDLTIFIALKNN